MQTLLLLHGAIGASSQLAALAGLLQNHYHVHTLSFTGHGGNLTTDQPFSIELFAADVLGYMEQHGLEKASIFGYSMGGYVAMYLARHHPEKIEKVITLATKFHWDETTSAKEVQMLNPEKIEQKLPAFAETLRALHAPTDWKELLRKTAAMMLTMGANNPLAPADYPLIAAPSLIMLGDRDKMVTLDETVVVYKSLPAAQLAILPITHHPIDQADPALLAFFISRFLG